MANNQVNPNQNNQEIPAEIRAYLTELLRESGAINVDSVTREAMIVELYERLDKFLTLKLLDYLPTEKLEEFTNLTEKNPSAEEVQKYINKNIPNAQDLFVLAYGEFRDLFLNGVNNKNSQNASI